MTTKDEQPVEQLDAEIRAIEAADPTETSGAALLRGAKEEIERLQAELEKVVIRCNALESNSLLKTTEVELAEAREGRPVLFKQLAIARAFHQEVLGTLADMGICTPQEGYLQPRSPRVSRDLRQIQRDTLESEALTAPAPEPRKPFKLDVSPEWCENMAKLEGDSEIGAGKVSIDPILEPKSEAERRVVEAAVEVWQRYQSIIQLRPAFDSPFWQEFGNACQALAAQQQEPTSDEESGDA